MEKDQQSKVTVVITSCGRPELFHKTLQSFLQFNTYNVAAIIIVEDSGIKGINDHLKEKYPLVTWIENETNLGQIPSIEKAYALVKTPYVFHCEDDWVFYRRRFIEESIEVLESTENILQVWIRDRTDVNGHPIAPDNYYTKSGYHFKLMVTGFRGVWHGFSFNPGLRRMADYIPYSQITEFKGQGNSGAEMEIGKYYFEKGFRAALLLPGSVKHIGWSHSTRKKSMIWNLDTARQEHQHSPKLAIALAKLLPKNQKVIDLGCGKGTYLKHLSENGFDCIGYEGTPDILEIADFDKIIQHDLTQPLTVEKTGTVICLEVAEHIEKEFEDQLLDNIDRACNGLLILSWALPGQGGRGHVNEQGAGYVIGRLKRMGYEMETHMSADLRYAGSELWWFRKSIYVFRKNQPMLEAKTGSGFR